MKYNTNIDRASLNVRITTQQKNYCRVKYEIVFVINFLENMEKIKSKPVSKTLSEKNDKDIDQILTKNIDKNKQTKIQELDNFEMKQKEQKLENLHNEKQNKNDESSKNGILKNEQTRKFNQQKTNKGNSNLSNQIKRFMSTTQNEKFMDFIF